MQVAHEPTEGMVKLQPLCDSPIVASHYERITPPEGYNEKWDIREYESVFDADPTEREDQARIADKFGVQPDWGEYLIKQLKLPKGEQDGPCQRYHFLLYLCKTKGKCDVDINFIEGRHRQVNVIYYMAAAKFDSNNNDIIPLTADKMGMLKYGVGDETTDRYADVSGRINKSLEDKSVKLVMDLVTIKVLIPKLDGSVHDEDLLGNCRTYSKIISDNKHASSHQSVGFQLATITQTFYSQAEHAKAKNAINRRKNANFEEMFQPEINTVQRVDKSSKTSKKDPTHNPTMMDWEEYVAFMLDPFSAKKEMALYDKLFDITGCYAPFYPSYRDLAVAPGNTSKDSKLTTTFYVDVMLILPKVYYILKAASNGKQVSEIMKNNQEFLSDMKYLLKYQFQKRAPTTIVSGNGRTYYPGIKSSLLHAESMHLAATTLVTYMIVSSMCFTDGKIIIDQALRYLEARSMNHVTADTLRNLGERQ